MRQVIKKAVAVILTMVMIIGTIGSLKVQKASADSNTIYDLYVTKVVINYIDDVVFMDGSFVSASEEIEGIELQWSYQSNFSKSTTVYQPRREDGYTVKVKSPKVNKTIYCRVRAYLTEDGKRVYGKWSETSSLKILNLQKPEKFTVRNSKSQTIQASWKKVKSVKGLKMRYVVNVNAGDMFFWWLTDKTSVNMKNKAFKKGTKVTVSVAAYVHPENIVYRDSLELKYFSGFSMKNSKKKQIKLNK